MGGGGARQPTNFQGVRQQAITPVGSTGFTPELCQDSLQRLDQRLSNIVFTVLSPVQRLVDSQDSQAGHRNPSGKSAVLHQTRPGACFVFALVNPLRAEGW